MRQLLIALIALFPFATSAQTIHGCVTPGGSSTSSAKGDGGTSSDSRPMLPKATRAQPMIVTLSGRRCCWPDVTAGRPEESLCPARHCSRESPPEV